MPGLSENDSAIRPIADIASDLIALRANPDEWRWSAGVLKFYRDFERHKDNPRAWRNLCDELFAAGAHDVIICLPVVEIGMVPLVVMRQRAVGHGGFHTGVSGLGDAALRWAYDCGSLREAGRERLLEEIDEFAGPKDKRRTLDFLFISHFDRDHINGVGDLMDRLDVDTVVLPYLSEPQRLGLIVEACALDEAAATDANFLKAIINPAEWLRARGAKRVVQMRPDTGEGASRVFGTEIDPDVSAAVGRSIGQTVFVPQNPGEDRLDGSSAEVGVGSGWVLVNGLNRLSDWCFVPHVTPVSSGASAALEQTLEELLKRDPEKETLTQAFERKLHEATFILDLKAAYKRHELGDANAISMSLYVGPRHDIGGICWRKPLRTFLPDQDAGPGWLLTGDAKLAQVGRRAQWLRFYAPVRQHVGALMLPHHGSHLNFHRDLLKAARDDALLFACKREKHGDPLHEDVWPHVRSRRHRIISDDPATALVQVSGSSSLDGAEGKLRQIADEWS